MARKSKTTLDYDDDEEESAPPRGKKMDPIIQGLFERLPKTGSVWAAQPRKEWLTMIEQAFKVVYEDEEPPGGHVVTP